MVLKSVIPRLQWPKPVYKEKRAITAEEHAAIIAAEVNAERKVFYQLCWHLGGSQGDIARLCGEDVDWEKSTVCFTRQKTKVPVIVRLGHEALNLLKDLPAEGPLFPYLAGKGNRLAQPIAVSTARDFIWSPAPKFQGSQELCTRKNYCRV
jgi:integrase